MFGFKVLATAHSLVWASIFWIVMVTSKVQKKGQILLQGTWRQINFPLNTDPYLKTQRYRVLEVSFVFQ